MRIPPLPFLVALALGPAGCGDAADRGSSGVGSSAEIAAVSSDAAGAATPPPGAGNSSEPVDPTGAPGRAVTLTPMLIRSGSATVEVASLSRGVAAVRALAARVGGVVGNTSMTAGSEESRHAIVELRVPSQAFDRALAELARIGEVRSVNTTAEDVGEEFTDVSARMVNVRRLESRLLQLLDTRAGKLQEVLELERELARVREQIERFEGRLRYLRTRIAVSTLTVTLHEPGGVLGGGRDGRPLREAFVRAWRNFVGFTAWFIAALGVLIPLGVLAVGAAWVYGRVRVRRRPGAGRRGTAGDSGE